MYRCWVGRHHYLAVGFILAFIAGCGQNPMATPQATFAAHGEVPTDEECRQFAKVLETAVASKDPEAVNALIDWDALLAFATSGVAVADQFRQGFSKGVKQAGAGQTGLASQIVQAMGNGGSYRFLNLRTQAGQKWLLFRLLDGDSRLNYHDFVVLRGPGGKVHIADVYLFATGETFSQTLHRAFLAAAEQSNSLIARLTGKDSQWLKATAKLQEMSKFLQANQPNKALEVYDQLPEPLKHEKMAMIVRLRAAGLVSDDKYDTAIEDFSSRFPGDAALNLLAIDSYFIRRQFDQAREAVDKLDESVGGDPYLNIFRANAYLEEKNYKAAATAARKATEADKRLEAAYWLQVASSMGQKDFDETTRLLLLLERELGVTFNDLTTSANYSEYVKSPQYRQWLKRNKPTK